MEGFFMAVLQQQLRNMRETVRWASKYEPSSSLIASGEQEGSRIAELVEVCRGKEVEDYQPSKNMKRVTSQ